MEQMKARSQNLLPAVCFTAFGQKMMLRRQLSIAKAAVIVTISMATL